LKRRLPSFAQSGLDDRNARRLLSGAKRNTYAKFTGNARRLAELMGLIDEFPRMFEIVEPRRTVVS
jgi:alkyl sulfatase BDS1-like metallo-beta-lactamase superfamily hydrolase